jgi:hypothetical protein
MPQIALDIDQITLERIEKAARRRKTSISNWIGDTIKIVLENDYPEGFFELFGAIKDDTFIEPEEIDPKYNLQREQL